MRLADAGLIRLIFTTQSPKTQTHSCLIRSVLKEPQGVSIKIFLIKNFNQDIQAVHRFKIKTPKSFPRPLLYVLCQYQPQTSISQNNQVELQDSVALNDVKKEEMRKKNSFIRGQRSEQERACLAGP